MSQQTITQVLAIERQAVALYEDAEEEAEKIVAEAKKTAAQEREQMLKEARQRADEIVEEGRVAAVAKREKIIDQAKGETERLDANVQGHIDDAMNYVLERIAGRA